MSGGESVSARANARTQIHYRLTTRERARRTHLFVARRHTRRGTHCFPHSERESTTGTPERCELKWKAAGTNTSAVALTTYIFQESSRARRPPSQVQHTLRTRGCCHRARPQCWVCCNIIITDTQTGTPEEQAPRRNAFKVSMIRLVLQFTLRIAFRCARHRYGSRDIRC